MDLFDISNKISSKYREIKKNIQKSLPEMRKKAKKYWLAKKKKIPPLPVMIKKIPPLKVLLRYGAYCILGFLALGILLFFYYTYDLPRPEKFTESSFIQSTKIYDRTGKVLLYDIFGEEKREIVPFDKISDNLKHAIIASEDAKFYEHSGFDITGIFRAILTDLKLRSKSQGGSTITQQLIRSVYLTNQKSIGRKIREIVLSIELERRYSKDQIFDWYLNKVPFGQNTYGAEAASQTYFSKPASDLTLAEAALLTAVLPAPSYYSPYGSHKDELLKRKDLVLDRMLKTGYINEEEFKKAKEEKLVFAEILEPIKAPHFVMYIQKYLNEEYGEDFLKEKGLRVYTSLNWELQEYAEKTIRDAEEANKAKNANNTALVTLDPRTGEILALVGSKDYFKDPYPEGCEEKGPGSCLFEPKYDVATMGLRQPGSSFKPFVYASAFKKGFTPDTILWDTKTEFNPYCSPDANQEKGSDNSDCYHPQNYDGMFRGKVSVRKSLGQSLNIPSVKLLYLAGIKESLQTAKDFGISTLNNTNRYGLALVLGGGEVNLLEMTSAYGVFATEGMYIAPTSILKIEDSAGNIIEQNNKQPRKVLDTQIARQISGILHDNDARLPEFPVNSPLAFFGEQQVAAKTGTTSNFKDGWTMGYTPYAVVGVWTGNNNNTPTRDIGIGIAAPMWRKVMDKIISQHPVENFIPADPITDRNPILLGQLDSSDSNTILFHIDRNDPLGPPPQNPQSDPQYDNWQRSIQNWLSGRIINPMDIPSTQLEPEEEG